MQLQGANTAATLPNAPTLVSQTILTMEKKNDGRIEPLQSLHAHPIRPSSVPSAAPPPAPFEPFQQSRSRSTRDPSSVSAPGRDGSMCSPTEGSALNDTGSSPFSTSYCVSAANSGSRGRKAMSRSCSPPPPMQCRAADETEAEGEIPECGIECDSEEVVRIMQQSNLHAPAAFPPLLPDPMALVSPPPIEKDHAREGERPKRKRRNSRLFGSPSPTAATTTYTAATSSTATNSTHYSISPSYHASTVTQPQYHPRQNKRPNTASGFEHVVSFSSSSSASWNIVQQQLQPLLSQRPPHMHHLYDNDGSRPHCSGTIPTPSRSSLVSTLACVLELLFNNPSDTLPTDPKQISLFHTERIPNISIGNYLERIAFYSECSDQALIMAFIHISRIFHANRQAASGKLQPSQPPRAILHLNTWSIHRLLLVSILCSSKFFDDSHYNNKFYAKIGGFSLPELNRLEIEFLAFISFDLMIPRTTYRKFVTELVNPGLHPMCQCRFQELASREEQTWDKMEVNNTAGPTNTNPIYSSDQNVSPTEIRSSDPFDFDLPLSPTFDCDLAILVSGSQNYPRVRSDGTLVPPPMKNKQHHDDSTTTITTSRCSCCCCTKWGQEPHQTLPHMASM